jgi:hypothetical protein
MSPFPKILPARYWRAFFVFCLGTSGGFSAAPVKPPELAQVGLPDEAESKEILQRFRQSGVAGQYYFDLELHHLPRRGDETVYRGRYWGGRNEQGALSRIEVTDANGRVSRLLVQNGEKPAVWRFANGQSKQLGVAESFEPLVPGLEITAFDLQMPFLYWPDAKVERIDRVRGRPAHAFLFRPPAGFAAQNREIVAVRAFLDTQYNALMQIEYLGAKSVLKTISLVDLKKVGEQWIPKSFDVRNDVTRDKTRFLVTGAALNLDFAAKVLEPESLPENIPAPTAQIVPIDP